MQSNVSVFPVGTVDRTELANLGKEGRLANWAGVGGSICLITHHHDLAVHTTSI